MAYTKREELMNVITHGIGILLACFGSGVLLTLSLLTNSTVAIVAVLVYSFSLIMQYCASTFYHFAEKASLKKKLKVFDHTSIYLLIAGTYTPFLLINLSGTLGLTFFVIVWGIALFGVLAKLFFLNKFKKFSLTVYIAMGWIGVFVVKPFIQSGNYTGLILIGIGGLFYTAGTYFYAKKSKEFYHGIWHICVLLGTILHFFAVLYGSILLQGNSNIK